MNSALSDGLDTDSDDDETFYNKLKIRLNKGKEVRDDVS